MWLRVDIDGGNTLFQVGCVIPVSLAPMIVWEIVGDLPTIQLISGVLGGLLILFDEILSDLGGVGEVCSSGEGY